MYLVCGLGNPEKKYEKTRHNIGFDVIDLLTEKNGISVTSKKFRSLVGSGLLAGEKVIFVKPQTYMNLSGEAVREVAEYYDIPVGNIIIICDDVNLETGTLRIRDKGSAGGHNGLKNIILSLASEEFKRIRIGAGLMPPGAGMINFVLGHFVPEDRKKLEESYQDACEAVSVIMKDGTERAMNLYNGRKHE